jgi:hypothetical protein
MQPGINNFTIFARATFSRVITWQGVNLTGYTAAMQIRDQEGNLLLDVGALSGGLTINGFAGTVTITIPASETAALNFDTVIQRGEGGPSPRPPPGAGPVAG